MSTLERTISMMETLPETDLLKIQDFIQNHFHQRECEMTDDVIGKLLQPMAMKDFPDDIETAEAEICSGRCRNAEEVFDGLEKRYNF